MTWKKNRKTDVKSAGMSFRLRPLLANPVFQFSFLALAVIAAALSLGPVSKPLVDSALYADLARNLATGGRFDTNFAPSTQNFLLPLVFAGFMAVFGTTGTAWMHAYLAVSGLALLGSFWLLAKETIGEKNAFFATATFLAAPIIANVGLDLLTDAPFLAFSMLSVWAYLRVVRSESSPKPASWAGFFSRPTVWAWIGFAVLASWTRNTGFLLPVVFGLHLAWSFWHRMPAGKRRHPVRPFRSTGGATSFFNPLIFGLVLILALSAAWNVRNLASGLGDSSGHYVGLLQQPASAHASLEAYGGKIALVLNESRVLDGNVVLLNTPLRLGLPVSIGRADGTLWHADLPVFLAYLFRLFAYVFIFIGILPALAALAPLVRRARPHPAGQADGTVDGSADRSLFGGHAAFFALWFSVFAAFHVLWPAAFSVRYVAPLAVPLALGFGSAVGNGIRNGRLHGPSEKPDARKSDLFFGPRFWAALFIAHLAFSAAVISWDAKTRWAPSAAAADGLEKTGAWIDAHVPIGRTVQVAGFPQGAISFYGHRQAVLENGDYVANSDYLQATIGAPTGDPLCFEYQNAYWHFAVYSKTTCP